MPRVVPAEWMPKVRTGQIRRLVLHWTAGANFPSEEDKEHYHIVIDRVGKLHRGDHSILDNVNCADDDYAAHTYQANTGSIGLALCGMAGANQKPFAPGKYPINATQWNQALLAAADLCRAYELQPIRHELMMHHEAWQVIGTRNLGKWDISVRTWTPPERWAKMSPAEELRSRVAMLLAEDDERGE